MPVERVWCVCVSTVSAGQLHRSRGFHVRSIDQVFYLGSFTPSKGVRNPYLGAGFPLRCFQRLSLPNVANQPCRWRDNWHTRGSSTQVLSYYGQASYLRMVIVTTAVYRGLNSPLRAASRADGSS